MKGEVGSCCHPPLSPSKRWETIKRRPESLPGSATSATGLLTKLDDFPSASARKREEARQAEVRRIISILHKWGIHTLGQFAALDKDAVANRLGPEAVRMWERANGTATRVLKLVQPPESFAESFEFENEVETIEPLLFMLRRFLQQLTLRLGALYFVAKELKLRITFDDKTAYEHVFKIPQPSNNVEVLFRMLHTHLEDFKSESPIIAVSLEAEPTQPGRQQFSLFETALRNPTQLSETLARLTGLLGAERVGTPVLEDSHRPDAFRMETFAWELGDDNAAQAGPSAALRRFRSTTPASVLLADDTPAHLQSAELRGQVVEQDGPYFASGNWWDEKRWARAEWDLQLANGALCRCHQHEQGWAVDGIYD
jgi:protein ImuB